MVVVMRRAGRVAAARKATGALATPGRRDWGLVPGGLSGANGSGSAGCAVTTIEKRAYNWATVEFI